ncbi:MAG: DJ-1/PfpI family protein [Nanoarchaeota archaeon]|nr:DJ-1/PfpI family protein [Nanoarchaeota archaeon]
MNIGILIYNGVEELDFVGPLEVLSIANLFLNSDSSNDISRISESLQEVVCGNGTRVIPDFSYVTSPSLDVLVIPGGPSSRRERYNLSTIKFLHEHYQNAQYFLSVCTGSLLLAEAGLLDNRKSTTHKGAIDLLKAYSKIQVCENVKYIEDGKIISSAGITAGIDACLSLLDKLYDVDNQISKKVRDIMEYY